MCDSLRISQASEQLRISRVVENAKFCNASVALAKAQALYGNSPCTPGSCYRASNTQVQSSSQHLSGKAGACIPLVGFGAVPESTRIARLITKNKEAEMDPTNPTTRFKEYVRFFPIQCPAPDNTITNANLPKASTACPLPNGPFNPVLPA